MERATDKGGGNLTLWAGVTVLVHLVALVVHGTSHMRLHIDLSPLGSAFVAVVIGLGPLASMGFLWSGRRWAGAATLALSMAGSLLFGLWNHFVVVSADHVGHLPDGVWKVPFQVSAWLLLVTEAAGTLIAVFFLRASGGRPLSDSPPTSAMPR